MSQDIRTPIILELKNVYPLYHSLPFKNNCMNLFDVFLYRSIGCTVFEMATRKPPWADMNPMAAIFAIGSDRSVPQLDNSFTPHAREFVTSCLQRFVVKFCDRDPHSCNSLVILNIKDE
jgi:serine/threonine protein kinase